MGLWGRPVCLFATPATSFPLGCLGLKGRESAYDTTTWDKHRLSAHDLRQGCDEIHGTTGWTDVIRSK
ncbi:hypothetical protein D8674_028631 [Pyrus ussuriensis x Pyrus communis]|uniref:Secreted protein n=1 Tax=Pyrus ussuriensis x Pyrus communis TaxID=2448454 RepID=A0A5N5IA94_9ROSA|nr:hypothetical protein D8674_028631 [Pyrus ussuriensis x Pyrus communis]